MLPNLFSTLALFPAALDGYLQQNETLQHGALSGKQRKTVSLAAAQFNQCAYCLSAHTLMGKGAGLSPEAIAQARDGSGDAVALLTRQSLQTRTNAVMNTKCNFDTFRSGPSNAPRPCAPSESPVRRQFANGSG